MGRGHHIFLTTILRIIVFRTKYSDNFFRVYSGGLIEFIESGPWNWVNNSCISFTYAPERFAATRSWRFRSTELSTTTKLDTKHKASFNPDHDG